MNRFHPYYGYYPHTQYWFHHVYPRSYPPVNPDQLYQSANITKVLMKEASLVLNKLADSKEFDKQLMTAAQASQTEEVKRLIKSIGITSDVDVSYTPDGLRLEFSSAQNGYECCKLQIALRWKN